MNAQPLSDTRTLTSPYFLAVIVGLLLASAIIPKGYMPSIQPDGSVQIVLCSATGNTLTVDSEADDANDTCSFGLLHLVGIKGLELASVKFDQPVAFSISQHPSAQSKTYKTAYPRGPPAIS